MNHRFRAKTLEIQGIVQGVGFRPFVYQLAERWHLKGEVANTASGVLIHIEGDESSVEAFCAEVIREQPALCHITGFLVQPAKFRHDLEFRIVASKAADRRRTLISPDVTVCSDCLKELFDPQDRRYRYPFINCTNCGPRYTIIMDIPYDRFQTSMKSFPLCGECLAEYHNPLDRRFHAQPNACPVCGPRIGLYRSVDQPILSPDPVSTAVSLLRDGQILAVKGLGGFHLAVDAKNHAAVARLRQRKVRQEKPLALMCPDPDSIGVFVHIDPNQAELLSSRSRPIVLLEKRVPEILSPAVSPASRYYGVMLPYTPLHYLLITDNFQALVMTSGNLSDEPMVIDNQQVFSHLAGIADAFLIHNRDIYLRCDDSVLIQAAGEARFLRRSRGYAPMPIILDRQLPSLLAVGAELKNTICLTKDHLAFVSQHIGDMENPAVFDYFQQTIDHLQRILDIQPEYIVHDLHPDYLSTRFALEQTALPVISIQHHHAHIVSCMAENHYYKTVIGLSFDGTGYGTDQRIWGSEVLIAETGKFQRMGHLEYLPLPGASAAIREPWRMGLAYLYHTFGTSLFELDLPIFHQLEAHRLQTIITMIDKQVNCPLTSSLGRLFDGAAAILGLQYKVTFEGQAAIILEQTAANENFGEYPYQFTQHTNGCRIISVSEIISGMTADIMNKIPVPVICSKFHQTLAALFTDICLAVKHDTGISTVALSGGVFQNVRLLTDMINRLSAQRFTVLTHRQVPANDGGIALGQAIAAASLIQ